MIRRIPADFSHILVFEFDDEITEEQFQSTIKKSVDELLRRYGKINLVYVLDTKLSKFTAKAWWQDAMLGLQNLSKWNRFAIVSNKDAVNTFTDFFGKIVPGKFKGFSKAEKLEAIHWVAG